MNRVTTVLLIFYVFNNLLQVVHMRVELSDFYPYGPDNGDKSVPKGDDKSSGRVNISFHFPFFDTDHYSLFININGVISFLQEFILYKPDPFPLGNNSRLIAPFWADVDTRRGGNIYYRESQDLAILKRASAEVRKYEVSQRRFFAKWVLIATWLKVAPYGGSSDRNNSFQVILATDGINSFSIFYYNKIKWTYGSESDEIPAQAGFNAGDGKNFLNIPNSRTPEIVNITSTSNKQKPGVWFFKVDGETVKNEECKESGYLVISPRSGIELGGTEVYVGGPCYKPGYTIICRFMGKLTSKAKYISPEQTSCITPPLYVSGRILFELSLDGGATYNFNGSFRSIPLGRNPPDVQGLEVEKWADSTRTVLTWNKNEINSSHVNITIQNGFFLQKLNDLVTFHDVPNSGRYELDFSYGSILKNSRNKRKRRSLTSPISILNIKASSPGKNSKTLFSAVFISSRDPCATYLSFLDGINAKELSACPTSIRQARVDEQFVEDLGVKSRLINYFHFGKTSCYRSRSSSALGKEQQCCYSDQGTLIVGPPRGGTPDAESPENRVWFHYGKDVLPFYACCNSLKTCGKYYSKRPSDDGARYVPPPVADTRGDPHLSTFDGTFYTFNGHGEYVLLHINNGDDLQFQGRMIPILDDQGKTTKATALTAFAIKEAESDTIQVEFNKRQKIIVYSNGEKIEFDEQTRLDFKEVFLIKHNVTKIGIYFSSGVSVETKSIEDFLNYQISIPQKFKGNTSGLLGFWDDSTEKEFLLPNGSFIQTNSSDRTLHYEFGLKWIVNSSKTLFKYPSGKSYNSFVDQTFTPKFLDESNTLFSDDDLERRARSVCGENKECLFDVAVTGKTSIGEATLKSFEELQIRKMTPLLSRLLSILVVMVFKTVKIKQTFVVFVEVIIPRAQIVKVLSNLGLLQM
ncbi:protein mesh-like isoform X2 [Xenia sp. Carnegie-2017]|uniref:protein mesh-like isoform X2 n=1 Tax=Xenia sp. Carnegie-2017 TaxID=2897299 RepID=UPI001F03EBD2|nr:protein mesh-like isoform X2 [Xenia sp. Carnegie-2017]